MNRQVFIRHQAQGDLHAAREWYERRRIGLGGDFLAAVAADLMRIETAAEQYPLYYRGFRRLLMRRFPYKIFFRIEADKVIVFRVLHAARHPTRHLDN